MADSAEWPTDGHDATFLRRDYLSQVSFRRAWISYANRWLENYIAREGRGEGCVALPAKYISRALETKAERDGEAALTAAEWHLLMVGRFLLAVECNTLADLLFNLSPAELFKVLDGLNAVGASATANLLLETLHGLAPVLRVEQAARDVHAIAAAARQLHTECQCNREADEVCLLQFAFEQGESWKPAS